MKKVISLVLVMAMVLSSMSFAFGSTKFEDVTADNDYSDAINTLVALGVVTGYEDGTYRPEKVVTRAEMAKLIVVTLGYGDLVAGSKSNFSDTQGHWADAYIALAAGKGLVVGTGDGKFTPDRTVSYDEAMTMIVRALGYTDSCNELKGMTWPTNFKLKAVDLGITEDVKVTANGADRGGVAQLLFNALETGLVTVDTDGNVVFYKDSNNANKILLTRLATEDTIVVTTAMVDPDNDDYLGSIVDLSPYMYQDIDAYFNKDGDTVYVSDVNSDVLVGEFRTATDDAGKVNVRINGKNKLYTLKDAAATKVFYNGVEVTMTEAQMETGTASIVNLSKAAATFVLDANDKITAIVADKYTDAVRVANEYNGKTKLEGFLLPLNDDDEVDYANLTVTGAVSTLEDIQEDDVVVLFAGAGVKAKSVEADKLTIEVVRDTVEGKITETNSDGDFYIDGTYYTVNPFAVYPFTVGEEGTYFLDQKGQLVDFEEGDSTKPVDYAVVTDALDEAKTSSGRVLADAQIKLVNASGEEITYDVKDTAKITNTGADLLDDTGANGELEFTISTLENTVIKYSVNSSNEITKITTVAGSVVADVDTTSASFVLANNVVIFNLESDGDVVTVDSSNLGDEVDQLAKVKNKNGEIEMLFVDGLGTSDTYAFITSAGTALNSDDVTVQKLTAYVDGVKTTYLADSVNTVTSSAIDAYTMVKLSLDGDVVDGISSAATNADAKVTQLLANNTEVTRVNGNRIQVTGGEWYTLADDVAVYVLDDGEFDSLGSASSVYTSAQVAGYAFDTDNITDKVIEVLFIFD